jgi:hypothetical protein
MESHIYVLVPLYFVFAFWCVFAPAKAGGGD